MCRPCEASACRSCGQLGVKVLRVASVPASHVLQSSHSPTPFRNDTTRSLEKAEVLPHGPVHTATTSTKSARPSKSSRLRV